MMNSRVSMVAASLVALAGASVANAQWTGLTLTDGNAFFNAFAGGTLSTSATGSAASTTADFRGSASPDQLFSAWWWVRQTGDTREQRVSSLNPANNPVVRTFTGTNEVTYSNIQMATTGIWANVRFTMTFALNDLDGAGTAAARLRMTITATNIGSTAITGLNFFNYIDPFIGGADAGDQCLPGNHGAAPGFRYMTYTDAGFAGTTLTHVGYGASAYTGGSFTVVGGQMGDTGIDNFTDNNAAGTAGDQSSVMQWNFGTLEAGASTSVTALALLVPTPGAAALLGLGGLMASRRRRA